MSTKNPNLLLSSLSSESRSLLMSQATSVPLPLRMALYEAEQVPRYAYFPTSGIASVVTVMGNGSTAEVGLIGREGLVGSLHLLGSLPVPTRCFMQLEGSGLRIPMAELKKAFRSSDEIRNRILEFVQEQALGVSQLAACQRLHEAEARLSRWLLMAAIRPSRTNTTESSNGAAPVASTNLAPTIAKVPLRSGETLRPIASRSAISCATPLR